MKKLNKGILIASCLVALIVTSCNNSTKAKEENLNNAQEDVVEAKQDLEETKTDSVYDFNKYKESIELKLIENEKVIADLKSKISLKNKSTRDLLTKDLEKLEKRNSELRHKIEDYKQGPTQKWELFKIDFNNDIDDLGKSISEMAERNMKK